MTTGDGGCSMKSRKIIFTGPGEVRIDEHVVGPPGPDDVLVETEFSAISSGTESSILLRSHDEGSVWRSMQKFPYDPGYSNVGIIVSAGSNAQELVGRRVSTHAPHSEFVCVPASELRFVPDTVPPQVASLCTLGEVATNGIRRARVDFGSACAVIGLGVVGQIVARVLANIGASVIYGHDPDRVRLGLLPNCRPYSKQTIANSAFDVVFEASGSPDAIRQAADIVRPEGVVCVVSSPSGPTIFDFHDACNRNSISIVGGHYFSHPSTGMRWSALENGEWFLDCVSRDVDLWSILVSELVTPEEACSRYSSLLTHPPAASIVIQWK